MRIISGQWRGRGILAPKGETTRPTADRTREALFSMLQSRLGSFHGLRVAALFAGSGALGLEALSRGAAICTFVEQDRQALDALRKNAAALNAEVDIRSQSATTLPPASEPYDLILMDPPYATGAGQVVLDRCQRLGWIVRFFALLLVLTAFCSTSIVFLISTAVKTISLGNLIATLILLFSMLFGGLLLNSSSIPTFLS